MEKMTLIQGHEKNAILDKLIYGPSWGLGDLYIVDKCNQSRDSIAFFPSSYNCGSKYQRNQHTYTLFSGAKDEYNFTVIEYEVFEVVK